MAIDMVFLGVDVLTILLFLLILVFAIGIVWRVEKELDWSYKLFVVAAAAVTLADVIGLTAVSTSDPRWALLSKGLRFVGAIAFLASILVMRDIVRKLDHEK